MARSATRLPCPHSTTLGSTGLRSPTGEATAPRDLFPRGLVGQGDLPGLDDSLERITARAAEFGRGLGATGAMGQILAHRAALLSVRLECLAVQQMVAVATDARHARENFDADRLAEIRRWVGDLDGHKVIRALECLQRTPDGLAHLIASWDRLRAEIRATERPGAIALARHRLGLADEPTDPLTPAELLRRIGQEVDRLGQLAGLLGPATEAIEQARVNAGLLASFNPSSAATLARRYEAATERGLYRAIRTIGELNRLRERAEPRPPDARCAAVPVAEPPGFTPPPPPEPTLLASFCEAATTATFTPLASFRDDGPTPLSASSWLPIAASQPLEAPRKRPDLRRLDRKVAGKRR